MCKFSRIRRITQRNCKLEYDPRTKKQATGYILVLTNQISSFKVDLRYYVLQTSITFWSKLDEKKAFCKARSSTWYIFLNRRWTSWPQHRRIHVSNTTVEWAIWHIDIIYRVNAYICNYNLKRENHQQKLLVAVVSEVQRLYINWQYLLYKV
jgi:hypothetical protein